MKLDRKLIYDVLQYWMSIEELTPFELQPDMLLSDLSDGINNQKSNIFIWDKLKSEGKRSFQIELDRLATKSEYVEFMKIFTVCVGVVEVDRYVQKVIEILRKEKGFEGGSDIDLSFLESSGHGKMCLATFKINHFGKVIPYTFTPSSALGWLAYHTSDKRDESEEDPASSFVETDIATHFHTLCREMLKAVQGGNPPEKNFKELYSVEYSRSKNGIRRLRDLREGEEQKVTLNFLDEVSDYISKLSGIHSANSIWVVEQFQKRPHKVNDDFMNSPYISTLSNMARTIKETNPELLISPVLKDFFLYSHSNNNHKDILKEPAAFYEIADPRLFNLGRWPESVSKYLSVCQQLAVSRICQASPYSPIVTVNGPPGTGKTTLLREVLADIVVRRASVIANISDITMEEIFETNFSGSTAVPVLKSEFIDDFPIVVVSNTNKAIENISKEIPQQYSFEVREDYFSSLAKKLFGDKEDVWGLLSLPLGKSSNWNKAYECFFQRNKNRKTPLVATFEEEENNLGGFNAVVQAWTEEKNNFLELYSKVRSSLKNEYEKYKEDIKEAVNAEESMLEKVFPLLKNKEKIDKQKLYFDFSDPKNLDRHLDRLYSDEELDNDRTLLFLSALRLHKYTLLIHRQRFVTSIEKSFLVMGNREFQGDPLPFLGTFCFFCPLISSTLASSPARFGQYLKGSIPWVLVDEASQVSPQSAVLMMQKAKRMIVVGDPQQLQPVVTLPKVINELLIDKKDFLYQWSPFSNSLQTLCDQIQTYGTWIGQGARMKIWTGMPLRAQRRSYAPMFDICNTISYENQMVLGKERRNKELVSSIVPSFWFDVAPSGEEGNTNAVKEEVEAVIDVLRYIYFYLTQKNLQGELEVPKSIMIISPFRAVATAVKGRLKGLKVNSDLFKVARIGTAHVMQGQQADIVIFVLGSKKGEKGARARLWATEPPNLINVAVSRAIETLIIIGDVAEWEGLGPMSEISYQLRLKGLGVRKTLPDK